MNVPDEPRPAGEVRRAFGLAVAVARRRRRLSQRQLAARAGIDRGRLSRIEAGKGDVTIVIQDRIASALGMSVTQLWARVATEERELREAGLTTNAEGGEKGEAS